MIVHPEELEEISDPPLFTTLLVFIHYGVLLLFAYLRDFMRKVGFEKIRNAHESPKVGLLNPFCYIYIVDESS